MLGNTELRTWTFLGLVLRHNGLSCHLWCWHHKWVPVYVLAVPFSVQFPANSLGKQQTWPKYLVTYHSCEKPGWSSTLLPLTWPKSSHWSFSLSLSLSLKWINEHFFKNQIILLPNSSVKWGSLPVFFLKTILAKGICYLFWLVLATWCGKSKGSETGKPYASAKFSIS